MNVKELRTILELIDGECEIVVCDKSMNLYEIESTGHEPYFDNCVDNDKTPFAIRVS